MSSEVKKIDKVKSPELSEGVPPTTPDDPEYARQKALAEEIMQDDSEVLRKLAE